MRVRSAQIERLGDVPRTSFEGEMVLHLQQFVPRHAQVIGPEGVARVVRLGLEKAGRCGFTLRGPIRLYLELMSMFGSEFQTDPMLPWTGPLNDADEATEMERAERLHHDVLRYLEQVAGPKNEFAIQALRRLSEAKPDSLPRSPAGIESTIAHSLRQMYPERVAAADEVRLRALLEAARQEAVRLNCMTSEGWGVLAGVMFAVGHGAASDPLFPWISVTLNDAGLLNPDVRIRKLYERAMAYLRTALPYLEGLNANVRS